MKKDEIVDSIYRYIVNGENLADIAQIYELTTGGLSHILEPYGITGEVNKTGRVGKGKYSALFKNGYKTQSKTDKHEKGETIIITKDVLYEYLNKRGSKQTLEEYLEYGPPKVKFKSVGKITAIVAVSIITVSVINPLSLFEVGTTETSNVVTDFFIELKEDVIDIAKDTFIAKIIDKTSDKIDEYNLNKISKDNAQVINNLNHQAINGEPGYFMLDGVKYIGFIDNDKPVGECFSLDMESQCSIGTYYDNKVGINDLGVKLDKQSIKIGYFDNDVQQNGLLLDIYEDKIIIAKINNTNTVDIVKGAYKLYIDRGLGTYNLVDINNDIIANYNKDTWETSNGNDFVVDKYDLDIKKNSIDIGLFFIRNNKVYYDDSEISISVDIKTKDMEYNSLVLYETLKKDGEYRAAEKITGCNLNYNSLKNSVKYTYLTKDMEYNYTKHLN